MVLSKLTDALILAFALGSVIMAARLARVRWWRTSLGKIWAYKVVAYVGLGGLASVGVIFGMDWTLRAVVRLIVWSIVMPIPWLTLMALDHEQHRAKTERDTRAKAGNHGQDS